MSTRILLAIIRFIGSLPLPLVRGLGSGVGALLYYLPNKSRKIAEVNLKLCFPELSEPERKQMLRDCLHETAITFTEMPSAWLQPPDRWIARIIPGQPVAEVKSLMTQGKGVILAAPHLGNWEVGVHLLSSLGKMTVLYRPPRQRELEQMLVDGRAKMGTRLVPTTGQGIKALYAALEAGEMVAILPDQQPKREGKGAVFAPFFDTPALTMTLVNRLARKTGAPVYFPFAARNASGMYQSYGVRASDAIADEDPVIAATELNRCVEACVRLCPTHYLWSYKRFDAQPDGNKSPYRRKT
ncbi:MAG: lysophospholipid acyltransferase family protein [bacterium]